MEKEYTLVLKYVLYLKAHLLERYVAFIDGVEEEEENVSV